MRTFLGCVSFLVGATMVVSFLGPHLFPIEASSLAMRFIGATAGFGLFALFAIGNVSMLGTFSSTPRSRPEMLTYAASAIAIVAIWRTRLLEGTVPINPTQFLSVLGIGAMTVGPIGTGIIYMYTSVFMLRPRQA